MIQKLAPLIRRLADDSPPSGVEKFPAGTLLPDGRLDLCKQGLGPEGAAAIAGPLGRTRIVTSVLVGDDRLGDAGAAEVAGVLRENPRVTTVFLGCNRIQDGARDLASAIRAHGAIKGLWIKRNPIGEAGARVLAAG